METTEAICLDLKQAYQIIAQHEAETNIRYAVFSSPKNFGNIDPTKAKRLHWCDPPNVKFMRREFTGIPFVPLGIKLFDCEYGKDRKLRRKKKNLTENNSEHDYAEIEAAKAALPVNRMSKKRDCPARCSIREIVEFPEYKHEDLPPPYDQELLWKDLHDKLNANYEVEILRRFIVRLPALSLHTGHPDKDEPLVNPKQDQWQDMQDTGADEDEDDAVVSIENVGEDTQEPVDTHLLTLNVTSDQETAIVELFENRGWDFIPLETHEITLMPEPALEHVEPVPEPGLELEYATDSHKKDDGYVHSTSRINHLPEFTAQPVSTTLNSVCRNVQTSQASTATTVLFNTLLNNNIGHQSGKQNASTEMIFHESTDQVMSTGRERLNYVEFDKLCDQSLEEMSSPPDEPEEQDDHEDEGQLVELCKAAQQATGSASTDKPNVKRHNDVEDDEEDGNEAEVGEVDESETKTAEPKRKRQKKSEQNHVKRQTYGPLHCTDCNDTYYTLDKFNHHKKDGRCRYECDQCSKVFTSRTYASYLQHLKYHSKERAFKCRFCEASYLIVTELKKHMRRHHSNGPNICDLCGLCFNTSDELLSHKHEIHKAKDCLYECDICGRKLASKNNLVSHRKIVHTDIKPYECKICGERFKTNQTLHVNHAKTHASELLFKCQLPGCQHNYFSSEDLMKHMKRHPNIPSKICDICGQGFYTINELKLHARTHSREKIHACQYCTFRCKRPGNLVKHVKTHLTVV